MRVFSVIVSVEISTYFCVLQYRPICSHVHINVERSLVSFCHLPASIKCVFVDCRLTVVRYSIDPHVAMPIITVKRSLISFFHLTVEVLCFIKNYLSIMLMTEY